MCNQFVSTLGAILLVAVTLYAERAFGQTGDVRLSRDPLHVVIPQDAKIQSAGRIGEGTLVVWGTSRAEGDTVAVNTLVMQILRDTALVGPQEVLTSNNARPFGFVQVLPMQHYFLVVWNDKRGGDSAAYLQRVDTSGIRIGSEEILSPQAIDSIGVILLPHPLGLRLLWSNMLRSDTNIFWRDVDTTNGVLGERQGPLVGSTQQILSPSRLPGITLLVRGDYMPILYTPDGKFDTLNGEAARHFTLPYYLDDDGGLLTLENGRVNFYTTLLDTVAYKSKEVPQGVSAHPGTWVITRDSIGAVRVLWASGAVGRFLGGIIAWSSVIMDIYGSTLTPADTFEKPQRVASRETASLGVGSTYTQTFRDAKQVRGCGNQYSTDVSFSFHISYHHNGDDSEFDGSQTMYFNVDGLGRVFGATNYYSIPKLIPLVRTCPSPPTIPLIRLRSDTISQIAVVLEHDTIRLSALGAVIPVNIPDYSPAIRRVGDDLLVAWLTRGRDSVAKLGRLSGAIGEIDYRADLDIRSLRISPPTGSYIWRTSNNFILERRERWKDTISPGVAVDSQRITLYVADSSGWHATLNRQESDATRTLMLVSVVYDPDQKQTLVSTARVTQNGWEVAISAHVIDSSGVERWRVDNLPISPIPPKMIAVPIRDNQFMGFYTSGIFWFKGDSIERFIGQPQRETPNFIKLHSRTILRWQYANNSLDFYLVDTEGTLIGPGGVFPLLQPLNGTSIALNDRDSGIAFVYGSNSGVRMTLFDKSLHVRASNLLISTTTDSVSNPSAVIRNDTLFVVWEDNRNGVPDIYSTSVALKEFPTFEVQEYSTESAEFTVAPNPAGSFATITTPSAELSAMIILDSYGRVCMEWTAASSQSTIDLRSLPVGFYRVVLHGKHRDHSLPLVIMR